MDPSPHLGGVRARIPQALKVESGEQLGLCVTRTRPQLPFCLASSLYPCSVVGSGDGGGNWGRQGSPSERLGLRETPGS